MAEKTRYSDEELAEFKEIILKKIEKAKSDYNILTGAGIVKNDTNDTFSGLLKAEETVDATCKEENAKLAERLVKLIENLFKALGRIENKTYGICRETGKLIAKERLRVVPHATLSVEAKQQQYA